MIKAAKKARKKNLIVDIILTQSVKLAKILTDNQALSLKAGSSKFSDPRGQPKNFWNKSQKLKEKINYFINKKNNNRSRW